MTALVKLFPPDFSKNPEDFDHPLALLKHENKKEIYDIFVERLKEYDKYIELRNEIRKKRYETQELIKPPNEEE